MTRQFDVITGVETSTLPSYSDPSQDADFVTKGWFEGKGMTRDTAHVGVQTVQNARDIPATARVDKQILIVGDLPNAIFKFDASSSDTDDGGTSTIAPTAGTGRWKNIILVSEAGSNYYAIAGETINGASNDPQSIYLKVEKTLPVTLSNQWIDIKENGGAEISMQVPVLPYLVSDLETGSASYDIAQIIEDLLNNHVSTIGVYTVSYSISTRKVTVTVVGLTTFAINWNTGSHTASNIGELLGFNNTDNTGALTYTSDVTIDATIVKKLFCYRSNTTGIYSKHCHGFITGDNAKYSTAKIVFAQSVNGFTGLEEGEEYFTDSNAGAVVKREDSNVYSEYCGFSETASKLVCSKSDIKPIQNPDNWGTVISTKDYGENTALWNTHENSLGKGLRVSCNPVGGGTSVYKVQYKLGAGLPWIDATTPAMSFNNWYNDVNAQFSTSYNNTCYVDESGRGLIAFLSDGSNRNVYIAYSNDLVNWSLANGGATIKAVAATCYIGGFIVRNNKAFFCFNTGTQDTYPAFSDDTGSGFDSWTCNTNSMGLKTLYPKALGLQYFPAESGANQYRFIVCGQHYTGTPGCYYCKGDLSGTGNLTFTSNIFPYLTGVFDFENNTMFSMIMETTTSYTSVKTGNTYNAGTLTSSTSTDIAGGGGGTRDAGYNGYSTTAASYETFIHNQGRRAVITNGKLFYVYHETVGAVTQTVLYSNFDVYGSGTWTRTSIANTSNHSQECCIGYVAAINSLVIAWKYNTSTLSNNLVYGQIFAKVLELGASSYKDLGEIQIDGGKAQSGRASLLMLTTNEEGATATWTESNGSYVVIKGNSFV